MAWEPHCSGLRSIPSASSAAHTIPLVKPGGGGGVFQWQGWKNTERSKVQINPQWKPGLERARPQSGQRIHFPIGQRKRQDSGGLWMSFSGPVRGVMWTQTWKRLVPIQPERIYSDEVARNSRIQVSEVCCVTPKRTRGCNFCRKVLQLSKYWVKGLSTAVNESISREEIWMLRGSLYIWMISGGKFFQRWMGSDYATANSA